MDETELIARYNYDTFVPEKFMPWMNFSNSPALGVAAPDFPLCDLDGNEIMLSAIWCRHAYTIVEFGSFT